MKVELLLCEAATAHPDGTFSMLRGGINQVMGPSEPLPFQGTLVARMVAGMGDTGAHQFDLRCIDADGAPVMATLTGQFAVPQGGGLNALILALRMMLPKFGRYTFVLRIDNMIDGELGLDAMQQREEKTESSASRGSMAVVGEGTPFEELEWLRLSTARLRDWMDQNPY